MEQIAFEGKNTEEAINKAAQHFNLPLNRLKVEVLEAGSSGLLGLIGARRAKILVSPLQDTSRQDLSDVMQELTGTEMASGRARPSQRPQPQAVEPDLDLDPEEDNQFERPQRRTEEPEVVEAAREVLARIISTVDQDAHIEASNGRRGIELVVEGGEPGIIIGRRGSTLDALQYLTARIISHQQGRPVRISVDAGGYRRRRRESLEDLALNMARKARQSGRPTSVGPLPAPERRLVHLALKDEVGINTTSRGRGELKKVLIIPK